MTEPRKPAAGWYLAPGGQRRWWNGEEWHDTKAPAAAPVAGGAAPRAAVSGIAVAAMILGILGVLVAGNALFKPKIFLGITDVYGPVVLGALAVVLSAASGGKGGGFRVAGFICGAVAILAGVLIIAALAG